VTKMSANNALMQGPVSAACPLGRPGRPQTILHLLLQPKRGKREGSACFFLTSLQTVQRVSATSGPRSVSPLFFFLFFFFCLLLSSLPVSPPACPVRRQLPSQYIYIYIYKINKYESRHCWAGIVTRRRVSVLLRRANTYLAVS
jgi:hypothetical protein